MSIPVKTTFVPANGNNFPVVHIDHVKGGQKAVHTSGEMTSYPTGLLSSGTVMYVVDINQEFWWNGSSWNRKNTGVYVFTQASPSQTWQIKHVLGYRPNIYVQEANTSGQIIPHIQHDSTTQVTLHFGSARAGIAYLS